jgi:hypothetical protein
MVLHRPFEPAGVTGHGELEARDAGEAACHAYSLMGGRREAAIYEKEES